MEGRGGEALPMGVPGNWGGAGAGSDPAQGIRVDLTEEREERN